MNFPKATTYRQVALWLASILVGVAAVLYARAISETQDWVFHAFSVAPIAVSIATPFLFVLATFIVRRLAPDAKGSGIPQVLEAIELGRANPASEDPWRSSLVSLRTAAFKILSSLVGILGGASIGREGPTVQIAASGFAWVGRQSRRFVPGINLPSYLTAGAAAGVAAAFNTPLAGIAFAIEEIAGGTFDSFRRTTMLAVIVSGMTAQAIVGNYLYFGHPALRSPGASVIFQALLIGLVAGLGGGLLARILAYPKVTRLPRHWAWRSFSCGVICAVIAYATHGATLGSGYEVTRTALAAKDVQEFDALFPVWKLVTTVLSYLSGMAGGIFSPSLSIGAGIGLAIAKICHFVNFKSCALLGMVAFFSGAVQAPLTGVIIVMEMTDQHALILPFMAAAFLGHGAGRWVMPVPLYHFLAQRFEEG